MTAVLSLGAGAGNAYLQTLVVKPRRSIGPIVAQVTIEERHHDEMEITDHPVEAGATVSDHTFSRPAELSIRCAWSDSPSSPSAQGLAVSAGAAMSQAVAAVAGAYGLGNAITGALSGNSQSTIKDMYQKLLALKNQREPFDVMTGKRSYGSMLVKSLSVTTDPKTENALMVHAVFREVIVAKTATVQLPPAARQKNPQTTAATADAGTKQLAPADGAAIPSEVLARGYRD